MRNSFERMCNFQFCYFFACDQNRVNLGLDKANYPDKVKTFPIYIDVQYDCSQHNDWRWNSAWLQLKDLCKNCPGWLEEGSGQQVNTEQWKPGAKRRHMASSITDTRSPPHARPPIRPTWCCWLLCLCASYTARQLTPASIVAAICSFFLSSDLTS